MSKIGIGVCGSFCTLKQLTVACEALSAEGYDLVPVFSFNVDKTDTRFYMAADFREEMIKITGKEPIATIVGAEPLGTTDPLDLMLVAPCTGNTLAKIAAGITDTPVTLAVKAHLRNSRPVLIALSTNDALGANAKNLGLLLNTKNVYFVPFCQDSPEKKQNSMISDLGLLSAAVKAALTGRQLQPVIIQWEAVTGK